MDGSQQFQRQIIHLVRAFGWHRPMMTPCGLPVSIAEAHAIMILSQNDLITQNQLCASLNLSKSTVSRLVGKLVKRGWVNKQKDKIDRRAVQLSLTVVGIKKAEELARARRQKLNSIWNHLSVFEQNQLSSALGNLLKAVHAQN